MKFIYADTIQLLHRVLFVGNILEKKKRKSNDVTLFFNIVDIVFFINIESKNSFTKDTMLWLPTLKDNMVSTKSLNRFKKNEKRSMPFFKDRYGSFIHISYFYLSMESIESSISVFIRYSYPSFYFSFSLSLFVGFNVVPAHFPLDHPFRFIDAFVIYNIFRFITICDSRIVRTIKERITFLIFNFIGSIYKR